MSEAWNGRVDLTFMDPWVSRGHTKHYYLDLSWTLTAEVALHARLSSVGALEETYWVVSCSGDDYLEGEMGEDWPINVLGASSIPATLLHLHDSLQPTLWLADAREKTEAFVQSCWVEHRRWRRYNNDGGLALLAESQGIEMGR